MEDRIMISMVIGNDERNLNYIWHTFMKTSEGNEDDTNIANLDDDIVILLNKETFSCFMVQNLTCTQTYTSL